MMGTGDLHENWSKSPAHGKAEEERAFMRAVMEGLADLDAGRELSLEDVTARMGLT